MSFIEQFVDALTPHAGKLNDTIASAGLFLHSKLDSIEQAIRESAQSDWADHWFRFTFKKKLLSEEEQELFEVPMNEIWRLQAITVDGVQEKSPAFILAIDKVALAISAIKEGIGTEGLGGDIVILPGESLFIRARAEGTISFTLHCIRQQIPLKPTTTGMGTNKGRTEPFNTHDPERDLITARTGIYTEIPGQDSLVDPTVP